MRNLFKYFLLVTTSLLAFVGTGEGDSKEVLYKVEQGLEQEQGSIFENKAYKFPGLQRGEEQIGTFNNPSGPPSKHHPNTFHSASHAVELKLQSIASQYILYSNAAHRSLSGTDIIFPFQYFW